MAREDEYLKAFQGKHVLAVGEKGTKKVSVKGLKPGTKYSDVRVVYDVDSSNSLSKQVSDAVAVPEFTTLPINVTGVSLDKETLEVEEGATAQLKATVAPANATNKGIAWASDNNAVATIKNGTVTGVKEGKANVAVHTNDGDKKAVAKIIVTAKPALAPEPPAEG